MRIIAMAVYAHVAIGNAYLAPVIGCNDYSYNNDRKGFLQINTYMLLALTHHMPSGIVIGRRVAVSQ